MNPIKVYVQGAVPRIDYRTARISQGAVAQVIQDDLIAALLDSLRTAIHIDFSEHDDDLSGCRVYRAGVKLYELTDEEQSFLALLNRNRSLELLAADAGFKESLTNLIDGFTAKQHAKEISQWFTDVDVVPEPILVKVPNDLNDTDRRRMLRILNTQYGWPAHPIVPSYTPDVDATDVSEPEED
jgi:hypothetical protein